MAPFAGWIYLHEFSIFGAGYMCEAACHCGNHVIHCRVHVYTWSVPQLEYYIGYGCLTCAVIQQHSEGVASAWACRASFKRRRVSAQSRSARSCDCTEFLRVFPVVRLAFTHMLRRFGFSGHPPYYPSTDKSFCFCSVP